MYQFLNINRLCIFIAEYLCKFLACVHDFFVSDMTVQVNSLLFLYSGCQVLPEDGVRYTETLGVIWYTYNK